MSTPVGPGSVHGPSDWFLSAAERGNPSTAIDVGREPAAWTVGNRVEPLIHGADYFARLAACLAGARDGEELFVSEKTAGVHVSNILRKLGVSSRVDAAAIAQRLGI